VVFKGGIRGQEKWLSSNSKASFSQDGHLQQHFHAAKAHAQTVSQGGQIT
jgi:hypothetical protein